MQKIAGLLALTLAAAGCNAIPQDPDRTLDRIVGEGSFNVGVISSARPLWPERRERLLERLAAATGARPQVQFGAAEVLLGKLQGGQIDVVIGEMSPRTPWSKHVSFLPPLGEEVRPEGHTVLAVAAPNGENEWITLLYGQVKSVREGGE